MTYLEDIEVGVKAHFGHYEVTREEVLEFAARYDPQPFHLDDAAAAKTHFGRLSASGWHTCAMTMRMLVDSMTGQKPGSGKGREKGAGGGLGSPGVDQIRWLVPVYPGDTLRIETEVTEVRPSRSRSDIGSVHSNINVFNQNDVQVMHLKSIALMQRRPAAE